MSPGIRWGAGAVVLLLHLLVVGGILRHAEPARQAVAPMVMVSFVSEPVGESAMPSAPEAPPSLPVPESVPVTATERRVVADAIPARVSDVPAPASPVEAVSTAPAEAAATAPGDGSPAVALPVSPPSFGAAYLNNPPPAYPMMSRRLKEQGVTLLRVEVSREGRPQQVIVERSSGSSRLDNAASVAVRDWRFVPAREGDTAVAGWVTVPINWKLEN